MRDTCDILNLGKTKYRHTISFLEEEGFSFSGKKSAPEIDADLLMSVVDDAIDQVSGSAKSGSHLEGGTFDQLFRGIDEVQTSEERIRSALYRCRPGPVEPDTDDLVSCRLCGERHAALTKHLSAVHRFSREDYELAFPDAAVESKQYRERKRAGGLRSVQAAGKGA
ncbi:hypothetical protein [Citreimonas salinaria]|uniref:ROS/MUCR transcriptional regulator protein n=1 Tax=Citreimonas salinaria TaxID=321339 RepID=A0A1H3LZZ7_9RHOB|nr:hypothetical protein [Citreimonas salinaria]SDY69903.1 hypothetical protein SAMN05444340_11523 [Citreimonas salinaria]